MAADTHPELIQEKPAVEGGWSRVGRVSTAIYWGIHASCLLGFWLTPSVGDLALCFGLVFVRILAITGGYHRYFAHKSYKTSRAFQFVLAVLGTTAVQKGPIWWAGNHRYLLRCVGRFYRRIQF